MPGKSELTAWGVLGATLAFSLALLCLMPANPFAVIMCAMGISSPLSLVFSEKRIISLPLIQKTVTRSSICLFLAQLPVYHSEVLSMWLDVAANNRETLFSFGAAIIAAYAVWKITARIFHDSESPFIVAVHEAGHAAMLYAKTDFVSVLMSGGSVRGITVPGNPGTREDRMLASLGGMVAEEMIFGQASAGSLHDMNVWRKLAEGFPDQDRLLRSQKEEVRKLLEIRKSGLLYFACRLASRRNATDEDFVMPGDSCDHSSARQGSSH